MGQDGSKGANKVLFNKPIEADKDIQRDKWFLDELFSPIWHIGFKGYTPHHWKGVLPHIVSCTTTELSFKNIKAPEILLRIIHIEFQALQHLALNNLYLVSVEPLVHLRASRLQVLEFSINGFRSLKSLRKMDAPNLKKLQLYQNGLTEADYFSECRFSKSLSSIVMFNAKTKTLPQSYVWLFKMEAQNLNYFEYYNTQIIRNQLLKVMAKQRYPTMEMKLRYDAL